jgi:hypothetical protein
MVFKMVDCLNGSINGCLSVQPFVYLETILQRKVQTWFGYEVDGFCSAVSLMNTAGKKEGTVEKLFMETDFGLCGYCRSGRICASDI